MNPIYVTRPLLPSVDKFNKQVIEIFDSKILTNMGQKHNELEKKLTKELDVPFCSLFNNGTIALMCAIRALDLPYGSEVITTPFTFAATPHAISWNGLKPVFCDIEPESMTIDTNLIESLITEKTSAIIGVHVYGFPCNVEAIKQLAKKYNLKVIYDAAHAFSTEINGTGIGNFGDITMFSFHSTKLFNTIEGGCLTYRDPILSEKIYNLRNFGIRSEEVVEEVGLNGKMNEFQAAMGLENLQIYRHEQNKRKELKDFYDRHLCVVNGLKIPRMKDNVSNSFQYYPIVINDDFHISRDELYIKLRNNGIHARKYFYPACYDYECYSGSVNIRNFPVTEYIKYRVLCLPFYGDIDIDTRLNIVRLITEED